MMNQSAGGGGKGSGNKCIKGLGYGGNITIYVKTGGREIDEGY